jgi:hypothetical protein
LFQIQKNQIARNFFLRIPDAARHRLFGLLRAAVFRHFLPLPRALRDFAALHP